MAAQPQWFQQLASALTTLRASSALVIDRAGLERLFGVSPRTAVRLLNRFGGYQAGKTFLVGRDDLIRTLEALQLDPTFQLEHQRRQRLTDELDRTRRHLRARQVKLPVAADPAPGASLPSGMRIVRPGPVGVLVVPAECSGRASAAAVSDRSSLPSLPSLPSRAKTYRKTSGSSTSCIATRCRTFRWASIFQLSSRSRGSTLWDW